MPQIPPSNRFVNMIFLSLFIFFRPDKFMRFWSRLYIWEKYSFDLEDKMI